MQDAITQYEKDLKTQVFKNSKQTECLPYPQVKNAHKQIKEQSLLFFKEKAVGDNLQEFVGKVEEEI
jgi:hypothetical protein